MMEQMGEETAEEWVVTWFAPDADHTRRFEDEARARRFAASDNVAEWNPILEHRLTVTAIVSEVVPL